MIYDETQLVLFLYILMRMTGFFLMTPLWGRTNFPRYTRAGVILVLSAFVYALTPTVLPEIPATLIEFALKLLLELTLGFVVGFVMQCFFFVVIQAGQLIDAQMGMNMSENYDPSMGTNISLTGTLMNLAMTLLFFIAGGHYTLLRILIDAGQIIPYGSAALGTDITGYVLELFVSCIILAIKLSMPILAAELIGQLGMGILMKVIPQINVFAINFELKILLGLIMVVMLLPVMSEFILGMEKQMLVSLEQAIKTMAA